MSQLSTQRPSYTGAYAAAVLSRATGLLLIGLAVVGVVQVLHDASVRGTFMDSHWPAQVVIPAALAAGVLGMIFYALGHALALLRDIARK